MRYIMMGYTFGNFQNLDRIYSDGIDEIIQEMCAGNVGLVKNLQCKLMGNHKLFFKGV